MSEHSEGPHRRPPTPDRRRLGAGTWGMMILALLVLVALMVWAASDGPS